MLAWARETREHALEKSASRVLQNVLGALTMSHALAFPLCVLKLNEAVRVLLSPRRTVKTPTADRGQLTTASTLSVGGLTEL